MKKKIIILIIIIIAIISAIFLIKYFKNKDDVVLFSLKSNQAISSPFVVEGKARGTWFFEASFPVDLVDEYNKHLAIGVAQAQEDWMTEDFIDFKVQLEFVAQEDINGFLIFRKDNPSGLSENDKEFIVPVKILKTDSSTSKIYIYFNNNKMDPEISCNKVFPVERIIPKTQAIARATIEELLKGPIDTE
ncbi:MAG: Gmad2 immunoglobulin-like domain-containing protein, partial [bacterium]|nr:Gmad2 immunoglobulin-like domain-containing protein [bacterium]